MKKLKKPIVAIHPDILNVSDFYNVLKSKLAGFDIVVWNENVNLNSALVKIAIIWLETSKFDEKFENLDLLLVCGSGVDNIISKLTKKNYSFQIHRLVDPYLIDRVSNYVVLNVLNVHFNFKNYISNNTTAKWNKERVRPDKPVVGIMGVGKIGMASMNKLINLNFKVFGWARNKIKHEGLCDIYIGDSEFDRFLSECSILICCLPLTKKTENIINHDLLYKLNEGSYVINIGRGEHVVDDDLLGAIKDKQISGALLDVFREEPLPEIHPFWRDDRIVVTPHVAGNLNANEQASYATKIITNYYSKNIELGTRIDTNFQY